jgi:hypothetical protein
MTGGTDREWAYVAMSRGRDTNTLYLANPEHDDELCAHLPHHDRRDALDALTASLGRSSAQTAAIDHTSRGRISVCADINTFGPPPPSSDVAGRVAWIVARRAAERDELERIPPEIRLAVGL